MKNHMLLYSCILTTIFLTSCDFSKQNHPTDVSSTEAAIQSETSSDTAQSDSGKETISSIVTNMDVQLALIANQSSLWLHDSEQNSYQYAITDFDQNGRLEIVSTYCDGSGLYRYNQIYEVNESLDSLDQCSTNWSEGDTQPNLTVSSVPVYYDYEHNVYLYVFDQTLRINALETYENKQTLSLQNKQIVSCILATRSTSYENTSSKPWITCTLETTSGCFEPVPEEDSSFWSSNTSDEEILFSDSEASTTLISNEEYESIASTVLSSYTQMEAKFAWFDFAASDISSLSFDSLYQALEQSYKEFSIVAPFALQHYTGTIKIHTFDCNVSLDLLKRFCNF